MGITEVVASKMVEGLDQRQKIDLILKLSDELMSSLGPEGRKVLVRELLPGMIDRIISSLGPEERAELVRSLMPQVMDLLMGSPTGRA